MIILKTNMKIKNQNVNNNKIKNIKVNKTSWYNNHPINKTREQLTFKSHILGNTDQLETEKNKGKQCNYYPSWNNIINKPNKNKHHVKFQLPNDHDKLNNNIQNNFKEKYPIKYL